MKYAKMLEGRHALILGGDTEVGGAVARLFAAHGACVAVTVAGCGGSGYNGGGGSSGSDCSGNSSSDCYGNSSGGGLRARVALAALKSDVPDILAFGAPMDSSAMEGLCAAVLKSFPRVDILVSATDYYKTGPTRTFSTLDLRHMLDVNLGCAVKCFQLLLPGMLEARRGELVMFAPDLVDSGLPGAAAAAACAGAISSFARNVTNDYIRYRVRANTVLYPFDGVCGRAPLSGDPAPEDAANAALWYACYMSRFVTGEKLNVNGGMAYANPI